MVLRMKPESDNINEYLKTTDIVDWDNPAVYTKARELIDGRIENIEKIRYLFEWVRDKIPHSKDINSKVVSCTASEVLAAGTGSCYAKSHLLAALLRANKIPCGFCYQVLQRDPPLEGLVVHGLNGIYVENIDRWVRVDARGNTCACNAQFSIEKEQLAFPMDKSLGEFIYETIFVDPDPGVIRVLKSFDDREEMWPYLPDRLERT